ncbi:hypothetical protein NPX13_g1452 [Xylaria arbuscula]|uniref:Histone-lysine N-methyltransferase, H3 lysine-36 specific n=1 Tax=Xylaria arbuscula TaxID=114810 RepID=A0A9W8NLZ5_9PEZI|nr:hypothetical protein NPX13_g1452 [Xylaria arbuscula]
MEEEEHLKDGLEGLKVDTSLGVASITAIKKEGDSMTSTPNDSKGSRSESLSPDNRKARSDSASTPDGAQHLPKLSRKSSQKLPLRPTTLFTNAPDVTAESCEHFQVIPDCLYGSKSLGSTDHDALDCDCSEEWRDGMNHACGEDSDCINRATKMECVDRNCNCGSECQNQRFQRKQYADVSVIKTEKKGFGLRANTDIQAHEFIFEYIGEVINEPTFRRRAIQYDKEGIRHFYFMSLTKNEFVDATKKGNLGRFCNHSCNPNCYVDKWVVGNKLRMGIFAGRRIQLGEELVFNYNVDRYGADPQPCYCGEPNCIGFIGGKTQTERATKLSDATIEALGIDDSDGWDTAVAKKPRKKKISEDDEDYVNSVQARGLDVNAIPQVMATLMQCKEKWITVKLLERIQRCDDVKVGHMIAKLHGYTILKTVLNTFIEDHNITLQILDIWHNLPRVTKNKIAESKIESTIQALTESDHEDVAKESARLLDEYSKLEFGYRIPRKKVDPNAPSAQNSQAINSFEERRAVRPEEPKPIASTLPTNTPKGPRSNVPQRNPNLFNGHARRNRPPPPTLPTGWFAATTKGGSWYYYTKTGVTTWQRPTEPPPEPTPTQSNGPSKAQQEQKHLQDIIDSLTKPGVVSGRSASQTPQPTSTPTQQTKKAKWSELPIEKQMKIYENTLFPHVKHVIDKYKHKLPKDDLKRLGKEVNKTLVNSDYKNNRVDDPTSITEKQQKKVKAYVKAYFERAVQKKQEYDKQKSACVSRDHSGSSQPSVTNGHDTSMDTPLNGDNGDIIMTDDEETGTSPASTDLKRKRPGDDIAETPDLTPSETPFSKRLKENENDAPSPPPPPPPPPPDNGEPLDAIMTDQDNALGEQETDLLDQQQQEEEEERKRLREEEAALERENELNMLEFQRDELKNEATSVVSH